MEPRQERLVSVEGAPEHARHAKRFARRRRAYQGGHGSPREPAYDTSRPAPGAVRASERGESHEERDAVARGELSSGAG